MYRPQILKVEFDCPPPETNETEVVAFLDTLALQMESLEYGLVVYGSIGEGGECRRFADFGDWRA